MNDCFGRPVKVGDEIATFSNFHGPQKGKVIQIGKSGFKIQISTWNFRWVEARRAIRTEVV